MKKPNNINLGYGWWVCFADDEMPVWIEYRKGGHLGTASLGFFETHFTTSCDEETPAPLNVIEAFEANEEIIYAWEEDYFERNPRE